MNLKHHIGDVVCAIIENSGKFLIAQRPAGKPLAYRWEFPGGKVHEGETEISALSRELREELSIEVEIIERLTPVVHEYTDFSLRLIPFRCRIIRGIPVTNEHESLVWISMDESDRYEFPEADVPVLDEYRVKLNTESVCNG
jgi:8-oxo-dGTP diphosphatase